MKSKLHGLETLRAYAIFSVLLFHYQYFFGHHGWLETGFIKKQTNTVPREHI